MQAIRFMVEHQNTWPKSLINFCDDIRQPRSDRYLWIAELKKKFEIEHPEAVVKRAVDDFFTLQITDPHPWHCIEFPDDGSCTMFMLRWS
jgi:hypothetical protein